MQERHAFAEFVPLSAKKAADIGAPARHHPPLPARAGLVVDEEDALTDRSERFLASESSAKSCSA